MSASPTRVEWQATAPDLSSPLQEGNRVLKSVARQEALGALLAFSELHEQIRKRRLASGSAADRDLFETERFVLDEVLQLICDRAQAITQADGIVIALAEPATESESGSGKKLEMVCHASAGALAVERGVRLIGESELLQNCLESGRILRCDDCAIDVRVELDMARALGARSAVLVPLRGRREQLGVLQAFSSTPWAFTDHDVRCFDLFAELVLSALKPEDQDRRIHWLSDVVENVLQAKPGTGAVVADVALFQIAPLQVAPSQVAQAQVPELQAEKTMVETGLAPSALAASETAALPTAEVALAGSELSLLQSPVSEFKALAEPIAIPASTVELPEFLAELPEDDDVDESLERGRSAKGIAPYRFLSLLHLHQPPLHRGSRPGLNVVMGLIAVAALFSAGAWWGMQGHGRGAVPKAVVTATATSLPSVTTPPAPAADVLSPPVSDNLMNPQKAASDAEAVTLSAVAEDKLAALPKITGVRHWSSSMGSTVVIDMEDQVPYEVHRLMSPERIYFDLHDTVLPVELQGKSMDVGDASLTRVRVAQPVAGVTRIVLDTKDGSNFSVSMEANPYRLVVELRGSEKSLVASQFASKGVTAKLTPVSVSTAVKAAPVAGLAAKTSDHALPARTGRFRIVLDAGHGGWDLGTVGRQGLLEKDLVLDVTQRLGKLLQARLGSEVVFTRTGDTYLPLEQRADMANQAQADLFVSIHANYSSSAAARGVETYYTNLFSAPGSHEAEKHDDGTMAKLSPASLSADGLHERIEESRRLAGSVQRALYATLAASSPDIRNRGIKDSAFAVLTGTTMPAILTEISFVSSPADEHNLQSATYRQQIAEALYQGIARYQQASPRAKVAQLQTARR